MPSGPHGRGGDELEALEEIAEEIADEKEGKLSFVPELVKRVAVAGLGALFMTEEGIRSLAGQLKLPKEVLGFIVSQAEKTKDDIGRVVSDEVRRFLQSEKLREEFLKLLTGTTIEITAQVRLMPEKPPHAPQPPLPAPAIAAPPPSPPKHAY